MPKDDATPAIVSLLQTCAIEPRETCYLGLRQIAPTRLPKHTRGTSYDRVAGSGRDTKSLFRIYIVLLK